MLKNCYVHFNEGSNDLRVKCKPNISKSLLLIFVITLFYQIAVYNISDAVNLGVNSENSVSTSSRYLDLIAGGETKTLIATVLPANAVNKEVTWSSSNEEVATVSTTGVVTPISSGVSVILVKTVDGGHTDFCIANVIKKPVTGISLESNQSTLKIKSTLTLKPIISPLDASNKSVNWSSQNANVATVNEAGVIIAIASGTTSIIGKTMDGNFLTYCIIYVPEEVDSITVSQSSLKFNLGDAATTLSAKVMPDNLTVKGVTWTSSNYSIANVDWKGKVTPVSGGTAVITVTSDLDKTKKAICNITVTAHAIDIKVHVEKIALSLRQKDLIVGTTFSLTHVIAPSNATNKEVTWSSTNEAVATVSTTGIVTPISVGVSAIVVKTIDGGHADVCIVNVTKQDVTGIGLESNQETLKIKSTLILNPIVSPLNASNKAVIWSSGDANVASVSKVGLVTAIAPGTTSIIARTLDGNYLTYCIIYVPEEVDSITLSQNSLKFDLGNDGVTLSAKVMPDNLTVKGVTWTSSNYSIANVNWKGKVTPVSGGTAVITATSDLDNTKKATCNITVTGPVIDIKVHVQKIALSFIQKDLIVGTTFSLNQVIAPSNATNKEVIWSSSNEAVATVSTTGVVNPISAGIAAIVVKTVDGGHADVCIVNVTKRYVTGISLNQNQSTLKIKSTLTLNPTISPLDASNKTVIWMSGDENVGTVSEAGVVTAIAPGTVGIIARTVDGNYLTYCVIYVPEEVDSITLNQNSVNFALRDAGVTLLAKVMPDNLTVKGVTWTSSNYNIANVDWKGMVTPVSVGTSVITATANSDITKKATCNVTVTGPAIDTKVHVEKITLSSRQKDLIVGTTFSLNQVIAPSNATDNAVTWSSSNEAVATVSTTGLVTPISEGVSVIVVKTVDGGHADVCIVNVTKQGVTGISLNQNQSILKIKSTLTLTPIISPLDASNKAVIWSSGNENVATVSEEGVVTAVAAGTSGIIVKTVDGNYLTYCIIYVLEQVDSITLSQNSINLDVGGVAVTLYAKVMPDNLKVKDVTWASSNNSIANVDWKGKVTPVSGGTAVITATSNSDKTKQATCSVTVVQHATGVIISR